MVDDTNRSRFYLRGRPALDSDLTWGRESRYDRLAQVVATERLTATGTVRISFQITDDEPFAFLPGQWIALEQHVSAVGFRRSLYCIFSPPSDDRCFELLIRVMPDGLLSQHLATLGPGDAIRFRGPRGHSMIPKEAGTHLVLVATGVGISPFYSLCRHLRRLGDQRPIRLYWGLRKTDDICLLDELDQLAAGHRDFRYHISLSSPPAQWGQLRGRVTESVPPRLDSLGGKHFYLCGNGAMVAEMALALKSLGVDRTLIHKERFFNLAYQPVPVDMDAILARFVADDRGSPGVLLPRIPG